MANPLFTQYEPELHTPALTFQAPVPGHTLHPAGRGTLTCVCRVVHGASLVPCQRGLAWCLQSSWNMQDPRRGCTAGAGPGRKALRAPKQGTGSSALFPLLQLIPFFCRQLQSLALLQVFSSPSKELEQGLRKPAHEMMSPLREPGINFGEVPSLFFCDPLLSYPFPTPTAAIKQDSFGPLH